MYAPLPRRVIALRSLTGRRHGRPRTRTTRRDRPEPRHIDPAQLRAVRTPVTAADAAMARTRLGA